MKPARPHPPTDQRRARLRPRFSRADLPAQRSDAVAVVDDDARHAEQVERQALITALGWRALAGVDALILTREALATMAQALGVERAVALSRREDGTPQRLAAVEGGVALADPGPADALESMLLARTPAGRCAEVLSAGAPGDGAALLVGLPDERESTPGAVVLFVEDPDALSAADLDFVHTFATILGTTVARHRAEERVARLGLQDALTGLPNRALLVDRLGQTLESAAREERATGLLVLDVDDFRALNHAHGHATADEVLRALGARLVGTLGPEITVARIGADEFAVLAPDAGSEASVLALAERLAAVAAERVLAGDHTMAISVSTGIALAAPGDVDAEHLLAAAEAGMLRARRRGGGRPELVTAAMRGEATRRTELEADLRRGLAAEEFVLHFQPIVDLADGALAGFEALLRWQHPRRGLLAPGAFLDVAEASGFIVELGDWIVADACRTVAAWATALPGRTLVPVHVNVSAPQLGEPTFVRHVLEVLERTGIDRQLIVLELTESLLMEDRAALLEELRRLSELGLRVALDDFGTGYASIERLKRLPFDKLKIDRSFITELPGDRRDASLVDAMVRLGRSLDLTVVGEGVETAAQLAFLRDLGCQQGQGFHFGRPAPADRALDDLRRRRRWTVDGAGAAPVHGGAGARAGGEAGRSPGEPATRGRRTPAPSPALCLGAPPVRPLPGLADILGTERARLAHASWNRLYEDAPGFFTDPGSEPHRARWLDAVTQAARRGTYAGLAEATEALMAAADRSGAPLLERHFALEHFGETVGRALAGTRASHAEIVETRRLFSYLVQRHLVAAG